MRYIEPRFVILIFGYIFLSELMYLWMEEPLARAISALALLMIIYRIPSRLKTDPINWVGGSILASIWIFLVNADFPLVFSVMLITVFLLYYRK